MTSLDERVYAAHADAWQAEGRLRERYGGGALELPGARLSASGLPHPQWNNGDLLDPARFDLDGVRAWFAARAFGAGVPWGMRVPSHMRLARGRVLFAKRCMAMLPSQFVAARPAADVVVAEATVRDVEVVARIDAAVFDEQLEQNLPWVARHLGATGFTVILALLDRKPVATATGVSTEDRAGRCIGIFGVAVLAHARRRGIGAALVSRLVARAFDSGATLAHLNPNTEDAARVYSRLGFRETAGFDIYVDL